MTAKRYYVYILASRTRVLYVGVTRNLARRLGQHRISQPGAFTSRYRVSRLVYVETHFDVREALRRERGIKKWRREKKLALIGGMNPEWKDFSTEWGLG